MKPLQTSRRAVGAAAIAPLLLCFLGVPGLAQAQEGHYDGSDIVVVGKTGNRHVYKVRGLFVVASVGDLIAGCVVRSSGALGCQGGASGVSLSNLEGRPGAIAETLSQKNQLLREQAQQLETQLAELGEMRRLLNERSSVPVFSEEQQPSFDATVNEIEPEPVFEDQPEDDLNF